MATAQASPPSLSLAYSAPVTPPAPSSSIRIPALDGLRGIAILLVLLRHGVFGLESRFPLVNHILAVGRLTGTGVDLFFVLSGFLIGGILLDARESPRYYSTFYARRAYRILPLYFAVTTVFLSRHLLTNLFPGMHAGSSPLAIPWASYLTFTQNFFMVHAGWFGSPAMLMTWSLAVEEQFYLAIPFVIRNIRSHNLAVALAAVIIVVPFLRLLLRHLLVHGDFAGFVLMPCRADALCLGVLSAYLVRRPAFWSRLTAHRGLLRTLNLSLFAGVAYLTYCGCVTLAAPITTWAFSWLALFYCCCLLTVVSSSKGVWHSALCSPLLVRLGTFAYCIYLFHYPMILAGRRVAQALLPSHPEIAWEAAGVPAIALTIVLAALSWRFFEKPMLLRGHKYQY